MIQSVHNYAVAALLDVEGSLAYAVPRYQREYAWNKHQWDKLFEDIQDNDPGYFLGSIICINQSKDAAGVQRLELVDGQQRMATLSLLLAAVYGRLDELKRDGKLDDEQRDELTNLGKRLISRKTRAPRLTLQAQNRNDADYRHVLGEAGLLSGPAEAPPNAGNRKPMKGYRFFRRRLADMDAKALFDFVLKTEEASMVKIEVGDYSAAYILFESLNNRGMPLSAIDLAKNKLLHAMEQGGSDRVDAAFEKWQDLLRGLGDDYGVQERFFRHYYNAFRSRLRREGMPPLATGTNLIRIYERLIGKDAATASAFLDGLHAAGRLYARLLHPAEDDPLFGPLQSLERIQGTPSYLLLMPLLERQKELGLTDAHLSVLIGRLTAFFVRRHLCDSPANRDLPRLFMRLVEGVDADAAPRGEALIAWLTSQLTEGSAPDEDFRARLEGPVYEENEGVTRFLLCSLAEADMTRETRQDMWAFTTRGRQETRQYLWTIEHVFPQGERIPQPWVDMMAGGDREKAQELLRTHVHKLGNLTLSGYNSRLGNKSFEEKRDSADKKGRFDGYKNGLSLNEDLRDAESWSAERIDARTKKLADRVMELFPR